MAGPFEPQALTAGPTPARQSFRRLWVAASSFNSARQAAIPAPLEAGGAADELRLGEHRLNDLLPSSVESPALGRGEDLLYLLRLGPLLGGEPARSHSARVASGGSPPRCPCARIAAICGTLQ